MRRVRAVQRMSWTQIAEALGVSRQAVYRRLGWRRFCAGGCD
ncbi:helix-turn-helix domain-containing protein [Streptosporangium sp. NPDC006013]